MYCSILLKFGRLLRYGSAERPDLILHLTKTGDMRVLKWQCLTVIFSSITYCVATLHYWSHANTAVVILIPSWMNSWSHWIFWLWVLISVLFIYLFIYLSIMPSSNRRGRHCPSVNRCFAWRNLSVLSGVISMKLVTNIHQVSGQRWESFQGQRWKDKVILQNRLRTVQ